MIYVAAWYCFYVVLVQDGAAHDTILIFSVRVGRNLFGRNPFGRNAVAQLACTTTGALSCSVDVGEPLVETLRV